MPIILSEGWPAADGHSQKPLQEGDFYWVRADVSPVHEDGKLNGYLSVRFKPERSAVDAAESLYKSIREGSAREVRY